MYTATAIYETIIYNLLTNLMRARIEWSPSYMVIVTQSPIVGDLNGLNV